MTAFPINNSFIIYAYVCVYVCRDANRKNGYSIHDRAIELICLVGVICDVGKFEDMKSMIKEDMFLMFAYVQYFRVFICYINLALQ